jgi:hypothetical protein
MDKECISSKLSVDLNWSDSRVDDVELFVVGLLIVERDWFIFEFFYSWLLLMEYF